MLWRQGFKAQKAAIGVTLYAALYLALAWLTAPSPLQTFLSEEFKIRNRYVILYLWSERAQPALAGAGASAARCKWCLITSDKDFMPVSEYDAVLVQEGALRAIHQTTTVANVYRRYPERVYLLNSSAQCISAKFRDCEARTSSVDSRRRFDLCGLCEHVRRERKPRSIVII